VFEKSSALSVAPLGKEDTVGQAHLTADKIFGEGLAGRRTAAATVYLLKFMEHPLLLFHSLD
jgi:hypothetical protein